MIEVAQSNLVTLIAGAVIASSLLAFASYEGTSAEDLGIDAALHGLALTIAGALCDGTHPFARIALTPTIEALPDSVRNLTLFPDHLRATSKDGSARASLEFPPLPLVGPIELMGKAALEWSFDPFSQRCVVVAE